MDPHPILIALYEDNDVLRKSIEKLLSTVDHFQVTGSFPHPMNILGNCEGVLPDVILMDIDMPGMNGIEALKIVKKKCPSVKVLMLTVFDEDDQVFQAICGGASGYLLKKTDPEEMIRAIESVHAGGAPMSPVIATKILEMFRSQNTTPSEDIHLNERELEVLTHLAKGLSYKMIAAECHISIDTVRFYIKRIYEEMHVHSMTEAVSKAIRNRLV